MRLGVTSNNHALSRLQIPKMAKNRLFLLLLILTLAACQTSRSIQKISPLNQHDFHRNACGPCAAVMAVNAGNKGWSNQTLRKKTPANQVRFLLKKSAWKPNKGMTLTELKNTLKTWSSTDWKTTRSQQFKKQNTEQRVDLTKLKQYLEGSIAAGNPPILSLKQYIYFPFKHRSGYYWMQTKGHFIVLDKKELTIHSIKQKETQKKEGKLHFTYLDSNTGKHHQGSFLSNRFSLLATSPLERKIKQRHVIGLPLDLPELRLENSSYPKNSKIITVMDGTLASF